MKAAPIISAQHLNIGYEDRLVLKDLSFDIYPGEIFVIMGGSGCGKSTLLKHLIGLHEPYSGQVYYQGEDFLDCPPERKIQLQRRFGVLYQGGALWSGLTLEENVALPLEELSTFSSEEIGLLVRYKLALVGLSGFEHFYPAQLSGGMRKRAALARAMALDPEILFFDEPSAGLDPITSRRLDELIFELKEGLGATIVLVTHELDSIFSIGTRAIFLDGPSQSLLAEGTPQELLEDDRYPQIQQFLSRSRALNIHKNS